MLIFGVVAYLPPSPPHHPQNQANALVFEGGCLFSTPTSPETEQTCLFQGVVAYLPPPPPHRNRAPMLVFEGGYLFNNSTTLETERVCSVSRVVAGYHHCHPSPSKTSAS